MTDRKQWKKVEAVVRAVIHEWDPYGLLKDGAPSDELDSEILQIVGRVQGIKTAEQAAVAVSSVFSHAFQPDGFQSEDCTHVGQKLFERLNQAGLIHGFLLR